MAPKRKAEELDKTITGKPSPKHGGRGEEAAASGEQIAHSVQLPAQITLCQKETQEAHLLLFSHSPDSCASE